MVIGNATFGKVRALRMLVAKVHTNQGKICFQINTPDTDRATPPTIKRRRPPLFSLICPPASAVFLINQLNQSQKFGDEREKTRVYWMEKTREQLSNQSESDLRGSEFVQWEIKLQMVASMWPLFWLADRSTSEKGTFTGESTNFLTHVHYVCVCSSLRYCDVFFVDSWCLFHDLSIGVVYALNLFHSVLISSYWDIDGLDV